MSSQPFKKISNNTKHYKMNSIGSSVKLEQISAQVKCKIIKPVISKVALQKQSIEASYNKMTILSSGKFNKKISSLDKEKKDKKTSILKEFSNITNEKSGLSRFREENKLKISLKMDELPKISESLEAVEDKYKKHIIITPVNKRKYKNLKPLSTTFKAINTTSSNHISPSSNLNTNTNSNINSKKATEKKIFNNYSKVPLNCYSTFNTSDVNSNNISITKHSTSKPKTPNNKFKSNIINDRVKLPVSTKNSDSKAFSMMFNSFEISKEAQSYDEDGNDSYDYFQNFYSQLLKEKEEDVSRNNKNKKIKNLTSSGISYNAVLEKEIKELERKVKITEIKQKKSKEKQEILTSTKLLNSDKIKKEIYEPAKIIDKKNDGKIKKEIKVIKAGKDSKLNK